MSHSDFRSESERLKELQEARSPADARRPRACLTRGGKSGKRAARDPRGTSLGEVLSCRFFGLGKGALRLEILVDRMSSAARAWRFGPRDRGTCQRRFAESLKGFREALKPATVKAEVAVAGVA